MATIYFYKKPNLKNLLNRSLSFQFEETALVRDDDRVVIQIDTGSTTRINVQTTGKNFLKKLSSASKGKAKFNVLKF